MLLYLVFFKFHIYTKYDLLHHINNPLDHYQSHDYKEEPTPPYWDFHLGM
jgi:hypothetical protein